MSAALRTLALALLVWGCANAGNPGTGADDDDAPKVDAAVPHDGHQADTPPPIDGPMLDASVAADAPPPTDAPSGPFCTLQTDCTNVGECCFDFGQGGGGICTAGTLVFGVCFPAT